MIKTDIVIIGAGPVGIFAVFQAGMLNMSCHVIETRQQIGGQCKYLYPEKPIYDIPAYPMITAETLIEKLALQAAPFHPTYHYERVAIQIIKKANGTFHVIMDNNKTITCSAIIIAGGGGAFEPNKPMVENLAQFEKNNVHYMVEKKEKFQNKKIMIAGGGDSAVDWALTLFDIAEKVYVLHRRNKFRCHAKNQQELYELAQEGKIEMLIPYQLDALIGKEDRLQSVIIKTLSDDSKRNIEVDELLIFFGLKMNIGPIENWGLEIHNKKITVDKINYSTNIPGIYAIGDIAHYPGKLKLILSGFAEAATACHDIYKIVFPDKILHFEYSTNKGILT